MNPSKWLVVGLTLSIALVAVACAPAPAPTPTPAPKPKAEAPTATPVPKPTPPPTPAPPYYAGKTLRIIVGFAAGGGYDTYTRLIARHWSRHIPGSPSLIVENMTGAGSLIAANYLSKQAKPDGLTLGTFDPGLLLQQFLGAEGIEFDARKFVYIGAPARGTEVFVVRTDRGIKTIQDVIASPKPIVLGGTAPGGATDDYPKLTKEVLGANLRLVTGYSGTATVRAAIESGEVDGAIWGWESIKVTAKAMLESGLIIPILQAGVRKHPDLPTVPMMTELAKTEEGRQLVNLRLIPSTMPRLLVAPPGTPEEPVKILRAAYAAVLKDPQLLEEAKKANLDIDPVFAEEIAKLIEEMFKTPPALGKKLAEIIK